MNERKVNMKPLLVAAALLLAPAVRAQDVKLVSTADLDAKMKGVGKEFVLVDSRTETEFGEGHIPGAVLVPAKKTAERLPGLVPAKDQLVVFYCNGPDCTKSRKAYKAAAAIGYTNLREYNEGLPAWVAAGKRVQGTPLPPVDLGAGLDPKAAQAAVAAGAKLLDVRDADEYAAFRIAGAVNIPVDQLRRRASELPSGRIVLCDHAGHQIKVAGRVLGALGRKDVAWLAGGVLGWSDAGQPTEGK
jgi:rhodanese-related sulfurtransferase